jgi:hypothetical protein
MRARAVYFAPALVAFVGCGSGSGKGLDDSGQPAPVAPPPAPAPASMFQEIQDTIFTPICTACHAGANAPRGLRLDAGNSFALLVNTPSVEVPALLRVNPGNPDESYLVQKISGTAAVGERMPLGGAPLPQDRIDLVRSWIAAGAPAPQGAAPARFVVASTIPAAAERAPSGTSKLTVIFDGRVDAALVASNTFVLRDGFDAPVPVVAAVPAARPNVVELTVARPLADGSYQLEVHGDGPVALADDAGRVLDGDADGTAGGDFLMSFDVGAGGAR